MNYSNYRASLDIHAAGSQAVLHAKQGDTKRQILVTLTEDGRPYLISSDCRAVFTAKKPDGSILFNDCAIEGNLISYTFTAQTTALAGRLDCEIRLYGADKGLITSPGFDIIVDATVYEDGDVVESAAEVSALTSLVSEANTLVSEVNRKLENGEFNGPKGDKGDTGATGPAGADGAPGPDGKSAYQYAQEGGYTGTEAAFAAKLAAEKFANPNALTFTGAVTGSYDGSEPLTVEIPGGGGAEAEHMEIISEGTLSEDVANIAADGFAKRMIALAVAPYGSAANSGTIRVRLQLGLDNGESLTINPILNFVTNTAAVSWNKIVAFAFVDTDTVDVTVYRDGTSTDTDIFMSSSPNSNTWRTKQVYTGVEKITSVSIGLQSDGVIGKNTAYKVVGA